MGYFCQQVPRLAYVLFPPYVYERMLCITLDVLPDALARGAVLVAREDEVRASTQTFNSPHWCGFDDEAQRNRNTA